MHLLQMRGNRTGFKSVLPVKHRLRTRLVRRCPTPRATVQCHVSAMTLARELLVRATGWGYAVTHRNTKCTNTLPSQHGRMDNTWMAPALHSFKRV